MQNNIETPSENNFGSIFKSLIPYAVSGFIGASVSLLATFRTVELSVAKHETIIVDLSARLKEMEEWKERHKDQNVADMAEVKRMLENNGYRLGQIEKILER